MKLFTIDFDVCLCAAKYVTYYISLCNILIKPKEFISIIFSLLLTQLFTSYSYLAYFNVFFFCYRLTP